ncbi:MAG: Response regulator receiver protein [Caldanaerobacter subterraneus]|uniref:Stage 0 sporulation protein A homolog n=1 Tax=Caldanaerobacter subterraneus TaxID=911092 RepID=A0A101E4W6_9THEO|nr:response regulator [Caldanaerobacter subterraneus]KUK08677.1 MAG: Response regulator receiver protein [Caldanaerobacter subterraneus]HBT49848.1 histidine kinase [Caldanaerobacter subterraneus]
MKYKVMICDDEPLEREVLSMIINEADLPIEVICDAKNGNDAINKAKEFQPDIIFMDVKMPGIDGIAAAKEIITFLPDVKLIIITAYDEFAYLREALKLGIIEYLLKPVTPEEVKRVARRVIEIFENEKLNKEKEEKIRNIMQNMGKIIKTGIFAGKILGCVFEEEIADMEIKYLGIQSLPNSILIIVPENETQSKEIIHNKYAVYHAIEKITREHSDIFVLALGEKIVIGFNGNKYNRYELAIKLKEEVELNTGIITTVGISDVGEFNNLKELFEETDEMVKLGKFFLGEGSIIRKEDIEVLLKSRSLSLRTKRKQEEMIKFLELGDNGKALQLLKEVVGEILTTTKNNLLECQINLIEIMMRIVKTIREVGIPAGEEGRIFQFCFSHLQKLMRVQNYKGITLWATSFLEEIGDIFAVARSNENNIIERVVKYINENFEKEIRLKELSQAIYLNPEYFSRLFKKEVGCTFAEYLTRTRIEAAKNYLVNPSLTISEIAKKVGYRDANYFSKVFKKVVGISPTEFRELNSFKVPKSL